MAENVEDPKKATQCKNRPFGENGFPVIGIGASAGGLESLRKLFSTDLENLGMAYIVVIHMMAEKPSLMPEILQRQVSIPVKELKEGDRIKPDHIYVAPAGHSIHMNEGCLGFKDLPPRQPFNQIDTFFKTLALDQKENAVAIILSGTGSDGSEGIKTIKAHNGLVIVESEASAKYDGMPDSAVRTGLTDIRVSAEHIINRLAQYYYLNTNALKADAAILMEDSIWLNKVFAILQAKVGHDFSNYKTNTILRRLSRRMGICQIEHPQAYLQMLKQSSKEVESLFNELLIGVTSFFRDPKSFELLKKALLPLFESMTDGDTFRVWVPGCSTGEEVYSLAILITESLDDMDKQISLQIFGTDIDNNAINRAREGVYPGSIAGEVSPGRLKRFFEKQGSFYRIKKKIRDSAVFSIQDVIKDPPFSKLSLVCCRNLLIYLNSTAQKKVIPLFHYTLNPDGILILGSSETIGSFGTLFKTVDTKWKIFKRRDVPRSLLHQVDFPSGITKPRHLEPVAGLTEPTVNLVKLAQQLILDQCAPTAVLVDNNGTILYVQGRTGKYLETTSGAPSLNILDLAREGLRIELSSALRDASATGQPVMRKNVEVKRDDGYQLINLKVSKIFQPKALSGKMLVVFEDISFVSPEMVGGPSKDGSQIEKTKLLDLEKELQNTRESHQVTIEELESSNEELKSTNEELQSSNEELQSTNEELESTKEELQSLNEELQTVNAELQSKVDELSGAHDDMRNLLNSTQIATIFVDMDINVKRFTSESSAIINLIQTDIGRPLSHVVVNLKYENLIGDIEYVLTHLSPVEKEVQTKEGHWYHMRVMPYRTIDNRIDGGVITFVDITDRKRSGSEMENAWQLTRKIFDFNKNPLVIITHCGNVKIANSSFSSLVKISPEKVEGLDLFRLETEILDIHCLERIVTELKKNKQAKDFNPSGFGLGNKNSIIRAQYLKPDSENEALILLEFMTK